MCVCVCVCVCVSVCVCIMSCHAPFLHKHSCHPSEDQLWGIFVFHLSGRKHERVTICQNAKFDQGLGAKKELEYD